jgi:hypothetical protein
MLTPSAIASQWVTIEVNAAINRREKGVMRGVLPAPANQTPHDAVPPIRDSLHRYDAVSDYKGEVQRLLGTLGLSPASVDQTR